MVGVRLMVDPERAFLTGLVELLAGRSCPDGYVMSPSTAADIMLQTMGLLDENGWKIVADEQDD